MKSKIQFFLLTGLLLITHLSYSQWISIFNHGRNLDGSSSSDIGTAIAADISGNCYVTGYTNAFSQNFAFLTIKYNRNGDTLWTALYNGESNGDDKAFGIVVDQSGNVYVTGSSYSSTSDYDYLTIKYNSSGVQQWASRYNGTGNGEDKAFGIVVDGDGNTFVTGKSLSSSLNFDCVTIKYNTDGTLQWVDRYDGNNGDDGSVAIVMDRNGNIYTTGYSAKSSGGYDYATMKIDNSTGSRTWTSRYSGTGNSDDKAMGITVDDNLNVYVTGYIAVNSNADYLTIKYDSTGSQQWASGYNGTGNSTDKAFGITVDAENNVYVTGESTGDNSDLDYLTIKYNSSGTEQWVTRYNGTGNSVDIANALVITGSYLVITGTSRSTSAAGSEDMVTIKYDLATGNQQQLERYDSGQDYTDVAMGIAADSSSNVFVTGYSMPAGGDHNSSGAHMVTLKYKGENKITINTITESPLTYSLKQNFPNPFNPSTKISFDIMKSGMVNLTVYDMLGREVKVVINQNMQAGKYEVSLNLSNMSSGVYFYELKSGTFRDVKKLTLVK